MESTTCHICQIDLSNNGYVTCISCNEKICRICSDICDELSWELLSKRKLRGMSWQCKNCEKFNAFRDAWREITLGALSYNVKIVGLKGSQLGGKAEMNIAMIAETDLKYDGLKAMC